MSYTNDFWLATTKAQRMAQHALSYSTAFYGTAMLQAWRLGMEAPVIYWQAVARASEAQYDASSAAAQTLAAELAPSTPVLTAIRSASQVTPPDRTPVHRQSDDLTELSGVAEKLQTQLNQIGVYQFRQLARLDAAGVDRIAKDIPGFKALTRRFDILGQAKSKAA